ncbi:MAG: hypothetical protein EOL88_06110 [Bacteroidia bacterium]|nr:hypothetical protein [Bacteroidia bacterium]
MEIENLQKTVTAWAEITEREWKAEINSLNIGVTGDLYESFQNDIITGNNTVRSVRFRFNDYGIYVNYGVGKEIRRGNTGNLGFTSLRNAKRWFSPVIYRETHILSRLLAEKYCMMGAGFIVEQINKEMKEKTESIVSPNTLK